MPKEVSKTKIEATLERMKGLPKKEKQSFTLREAVHQMGGEISKLLGRGYTYKEISVVLKEQGIEIAPATLKQYFSEAKQRRSGSGRKPRSKGEGSANQKQEGQSGSGHVNSGLSRTQVKALPVPESPQVGQMYYVIGKSLDKVLRLERVEGKTGVFVLSHSPDQAPVTVPLSEIREPK